MRLLTARGHVLATALLVALFALTTLAFHPTLAGDQYDDSYITYRYAANWAEGKGLTFNSYERVNSASSFLYTAILALAYWLGFTNLELFAGLFGLLMGMAVVAVAHRMALRVSGKPLLAFLFVAPVALTGSLTGWAVSGMETLFFAALTLLFLHLYLFTDAPRWLSFVVLGLALLTRLEAVLLLGMALAREGLGAWRARRWTNLALLAGLAIVPFIGLLAFNYAYFGEAFPHPLAFKRAAIYYSPSPLDHAVTIGKFYATYFGAYGLLAFATVAAAAWSLLRRRDLAPTPLEWLSGWVALSFVASVLGPHSDMQRYTIHLIPVLAVLALVAWVRLAPALASRRRALAPVALGLAVLLFAGGAAANLAATVEQTQKSVAHQQARERMGRWIDANAAPGDLVASTDLGAIAWFARDHDFVDLLGLTSKDVMRLALDDPEALSAYVEGKRPAWIADTVYVAEDGAPAAEIALRQPQRTYRDVPLLPDADLAPPFQRAEVLHLTAGGAAFGVFRLDWDAPRPGGPGPTPVVPVPTPPVVVPPSPLV